MVIKRLLFIGAGAGAGEKIPGAVQKRTASATLLKFSFFVQLGYQKQLWKKRLLNFFIFYYSRHKLLSLSGEGQLVLDTFRHENNLSLCVFLYLTQVKAAVWLCILRNTDGFRTQKNLHDKLCIWKTENCQRWCQNFELGFFVGLLCFYNLEEK